MEEKEEANPEAALITKCRVVGREELIDMLTAKRQELLGGPDDDSSIVGSGKASAAKGTGAAGGEEGAEVEEEVEGADAPEMRPLCVGLVGYPNVGKSSTINALMGATSIAHGVKRVGVGSTPGKTKHFQTLSLNPQVLLCDCPGLVFPSFVSSQAEMVTSGILPIAHLRDHTGPMQIVCNLIPRYVLADTYGLKPLQSSNMKYVPPRAFLDVYCHARGFMASFHAGFDHSRAARQVLHDFVDGKLLYCHAPPSQPTLTQFSFPADPEEPAPGPEAVEGGVAAAPGPRKKIINVMDIADTDGMFAIPLPKHKSLKTAVVTSHRRRRKGERDPDPYGCHVPADPLGEVPPPPLTAKVMSRGAKGHMQEDTTFVRVQRPYTPVAAVAAGDSKAATAPAPAARKPASAAH